MTDALAARTQDLSLDWPSLLTTLVRAQPLSAAQTSWAMAQVMSGDATPAQIAGFAIALRAKGETAEEVDGLVATMLERALPIPADVSDAVDVVGTGGDRAHTVNISTMSAIVVAGAGVPVLKHGNRSASSLCGAADLLEELGVAIELGPEQVARCFQQAGVAFCFARVFHPALRHAAVARGELGVPTFFNFLGPLSNPGQPRAAAVGCWDPAMAAVLAEVFARRGIRALVFRGEDGLDELTTTAATKVWWARDGAVQDLVLDAERDLGLPRVAVSALRGGDAPHNADVTRRLLAGETGPVRDAVLLNAAGALTAYDGGAGSLVDLLAANLLRAADAIDSGAAAEKLRAWVAASQG